MTIEISHIVSIEKNKLLGQIGKKENVDKLAQNWKVKLQIKFPFIGILNDIFFK